MLGISQSLHCAYILWRQNSIFFSSQLGQVKERKVFKIVFGWVHFISHRRWCKVVREIFTSLQQETPLYCFRGRAIAQAVSRQLPTAAAQVQTQVWSCGILWWTKVAPGQGFSENFGFPCQCTFHLLLHNHLHCHPRLAQQARSGRSANSLTNQIIIILFQRMNGCQCHPRRKSPQLLQWQQRWQKTER
jgi:hypothetical protein